MFKVKCETLFMKKLAEKPSKESLLSCISPVPSFHRKDKIQQKVHSYLENLKKVKFFKNLISFQHVIVT